jgi:hypothetical protein
MVAVVIGSCAAEAVLGRGILGRTCDDVDLVCSEAHKDVFIRQAKAAGSFVRLEDRHEGTKCLLTLNFAGKEVAFDIEIAEANNGSSSGMLLAMAEEASRGPSTWKCLSLPDGKAVMPDKLTPGTACAYAPPLPVLLALKRSHLHLGVQWQKHMHDYHTLRLHQAKAEEDVSIATAEEVAQLEQLAQLQKARTKEGTARYGESRVNLEVSNENFFKVQYLKEMVRPTFPSFVSFSPLSPATLLCCLVALGRFLLSIWREVSNPAI